MRASIPALIAVFAASPALAATLDVRGRLTDAQGQPENGACLLRFQLSNPRSDSRAAWTEALYVPVENGIFRVSLGKLNAIPPEALGDEFDLAVEPPKATGWQVMASPVARRAAPSAPEPARSFAAEPAAARSAEAAYPEPGRRSRDGGDETERLKARVAALERQLKPEIDAREGRPRVYEVQPGDTLQSVAGKLWGDPSRWAEIYNANAERIKRGGDLQPGQKLVLPALGRKP